MKLFFPKKEIEENRSASTNQSTADNDTAVDDDVVKFFSQFHVFGSWSSSPSFLITFIFLKIS